MGRGSYEQMKHVFIVGLPRTGTKLAKNVLHSCPSVCCRISQETWFFGDLFRPGVRKDLQGFGDLSDDTNVRRWVEYMYSGALKHTYWRVLRKREFADREWFERRLLASDRSEQAVYSAILEASLVSADEACRAKEPILGDKTPGHLYHVPTIMQWFPDARVVHTFRDPRAIMASEWKRLVSEHGGRPIGRCVSLIRSLAVAFYVSVTWLHAVRLHRRYRDEYPGRYYLSKYEDLVSRPEQSIQRLCAFVGIQYAEEMLVPGMVGSSFGVRKESGFDTEAIHRWRNHLKPWMRLWITAVTRRYLRRFGYDP